MERFKLLCIASTSGTTGEPTPYPLDKADLALWSEYTARALWRCGIYPGTRTCRPLA